MVNPNIFAALDDLWRPHTVDHFPNYWTRQIPPFCSIFFFLIFKTKLVSSTLRILVVEPRTGMAMRFWSPLSLVLLACIFKQKWNPVSGNHKLLNNMDQKKISVVVLLDMSKAFDSIRHDLTLRKLRKSGVSESACAWLESYLLQRQ